MGIFAILEEECIVPKASDQTYLQKLHKQHDKCSKSYTKPTPKETKAGKGDFILHHYAGSVGYSVAGWLEKNKDPINEHTAQLFAKATVPLVSQLFQDYNPDGELISGQCSHVILPENTRKPKVFQCFRGIQMGTLARYMLINEKLKIKLGK